MTPLIDMLELAECGSRELGDRPIIFSGPMVRALIREVEQPGTGKTMTRRLAWGKPCGHYRAGARCISLEPMSYEPPSPWQKVRPGDRLWVRESFATAWFDNGAHAYMADWRRDYEQIHHEPKWKPSIHMPRQASRLTLIVTATKIERLQDISEEDARAEGVEPIIDHGVGNARRHATAFEQLWSRLHGDGAWLANPEVVALTFTVHKANIDHLDTVAA